MKNHIDWTFDFYACGWDKPGGSMNPDCIEQCIENLRACEQPDMQATTDGGWPRVGWGDVLDIGMYDGGPYWKPIPSILLSSAYGAAWHSWHMITSVRKKE